MKKFSVMFFALVLALFCAACGSTTDDGGDEVDTDSDIQSDNDTDTGDTDTDGDNDTDTGDTDTDADDTDTEESIITQIQKGRIPVNKEVSTKCVVTGIRYNQDKEDNYKNTSIKGLFVSDIIDKAQPYSGIFVFIEKSAELGTYSIGMPLMVKGTYVEYLEQFSQIQASEITILDEDVKLPEPAVVDPASVATPFVVSGKNEDGYDTYSPTDTHGKDAEAYESVLVKVENVEVTNKYLGFSNFEVTGGLAIAPTIYRYEGNISKGTKFESIQGILVYDYDAFRLAPRDKDDVVTPEVVVTSSGIKDIQSDSGDEKTVVEIKDAVVISPVFKDEYNDATKYTFYVSDGTTGDYSGLYIYKVSSDTAIEKGDTVTIKGLAQKFSGQWEVSGVDNADSIIKGEKGTVPGLVKKAYKDLTDADKGTYFEITDELTVESVDEEFNNVTFTNGMLIMPFINKDKVKISLKAGDTCKVRGIYDVSHNKKAIIIVDENDIVTK